MPYNITPRFILTADRPTARLFTVEASGSEWTADQVLDFGLKLIASAWPEVEIRPIIHPETSV